jgi:hypothetical protein
MKERILTKEEQILVLETMIAERALIIYVLQSDLMDNNYPKPYNSALKDEIKNHKCAILDYKHSLKALKPIKKAK